MGLIIFCGLCNTCGITLIPNYHLRNVISSAFYFVSNENLKKTCGKLSKVIQKNQLDVTIIY